MAPVGDNSQQWAPWWQPREPGVAAKRQEMDLAKEEEEEVVAFAKRQEQELAKRQDDPVVVAKRQE